MAINMRPIVQRIVEEYSLPLYGCHGIIHWARVLDIGLRLSDDNGADVDVVMLFALFHDSKREDEGDDPDHGNRGAEFARELRGELFDLSDSQFDLLHKACCWHTHRRLHENVTIQTCWDSDRLDLGRVAVYPDRYFLNTHEAKSAEMIAWAHDRATRGHVPEWITESWGIQLPLSMVD